MNPIVHTLHVGLRLFESQPPSRGLVRLAAQLFDRTHFFLTPEATRSFQWLRLRKAINWAYNNTPFYRLQFDGLNLRPHDIRTWDDFQRLPHTNPCDFQNWRQFLAVPEHLLSAVFATAGSTGEPKRAYYTLHELNALNNVGTLGLRLQLPDRFVTLIALPSGLWMGGTEVWRVVERAGGLSVPIGMPDPSVVIASIKRYSPNVIATSPSFMVAVTREAQKQGFQIKLDAIMVGGEMLTHKQCELFQAYWNARTINLYGLTEIGGAQSISLPGCSYLHLNALQLLTEIVDPATGLPSEEGELVFTPLVRQAMPLLRYRSGDLGRWGHCDCWPFPSIMLLGRADDMFVAGDMNFYGHVIAEAISRMEGATGRIAIHIDKVDLLDHVEIHVEGCELTSEMVRNSLFLAYPEMKSSLNSRYMKLSIHIVSQLSDQIKSLRIVDSRERM